MWFNDLYFEPSSMLGVLSSGVLGFGADVSAFFFSFAAIDCNLSLIILGKTCKMNSSKNWSDLNNYVHQFNTHVVVEEITHVSKDFYYNLRKVNVNYWWGSQTVIELWPPFENLCSSASQSKVSSVYGAVSKRNGTFSLRFT